MEKIPLLFITTSKKKYKHISFLAKDFGIKVYWVNKDYSEIQENNMNILLKRAIEEIKTPYKNTFFIIEQTSVFLSSYSENDAKGPGYYFKDWWKSKSEDELKLIISRNPLALIESGIALNIPNYSKPLIFVNTQKGKVSFEGKVLEANKKYEWLKDKDFNFYFSPKKSLKVNSEMDMDEFLKYDFRKPNVEKVCERINEYSAILNSGVKIDYLSTLVSKYSRSKPEGTIVQSTMSKYDDGFNE